eukprot:CAMPEP_0173226440 /NCGR_PEP_ID=MMETSP1142-20121109/5437_1 /TAXON_ID=483371 /ORGANISM="non described non described, Strain CCMP2298" /LENGTH=449 /DNA_ID=CAMNT_0014154901 /DNA_START=473 /DNA_END=1819 /DNA_ORIENTATION=+
MSTIYLTEPPTLGKVLIKTTFGDIDVELWAKEAPLACRNFVQLSMEGYYDDCPVHRVLKGFMLQMGDPTGTGKGGQSIWKGRPFKDEIHGRLKFNHRGLLAMANENKPNTNQSQFFLTLDACEWLDRKHTIFGKVTGNTIFNVLRAAEVEVDEGGRPLEEQLRITGIDVLNNPFDDIVPRDLAALKKKDEVEVEVEAEKPKQRRAVKDKKLLSFGEEEEEEGVAIRGMHSSHDSRFKDKKLSSKSSRQLKSGSAASSSSMAAYGSAGARGQAPRDAPLASAGGEDGDEDGDGDGGVNSAENFDRMMRQQLTAKRAESRGEQPEEVGGAVLDVEGMAALQGDSRKGEMKAQSDTYKRLKEDLLRAKRAVNVLTGVEAAQELKQTAFQQMVSPLEQRRQKYLSRKDSALGGRADSTLAKLQMFTQQKGLRIGGEGGLHSCEIAEVPQQKGL